MRRVFRSILAVLAIIMLSAPLSMIPAFAQLNDLFQNYPVNYDPAYVVGRSTSADSIDECLKRKEFFFNEVYNIWVDGMVRCEKNSKGVLSKSTINGISSAPEDEQACKNLREDQILINGTPSENQARYWSEHCAVNLGTVGGAGPSRPAPVTSGSSTSGSRPLSGGIRLGPGSTTSTPSTSTGSTGTPCTPTTPAQPGATESSTPASTGAAPCTTNFNPVYTGPGVQVPNASLVATGISKETSLVDLIIFYTNVTLPYVSVLSIFAFVVAGLYYILTFANEELNGKAKTIMIYVVIGIVIIMSSYTLVNVLLSLSATAG